MADVALFTLGLLSGIAGGLVLKRNGLKFIPQSLDMGPLSKKRYEEG
jgi:hypothetical protein